MSISQTLTSRQTNLAPDWLLNVQRADARSEGPDPELGEGEVNMTEVASVSGGPADKSRSASQSRGNTAPPSVHKNLESDAPVISAEDAIKEQPPHTGLGEDGMGLEDDEKATRGRPAAVRTVSN
jgi:hypothetical protein